MILKGLSENTAASEDFCCEHGLSLYVETDQHRLLFDTGASGLFSEVQEIMPLPSGNTELYQKAGEVFVPDDFAHEQNLVIW